MFLLLKKIRISGWIREYPMGAYDSEDIDIEPIDKRFLEEMVQQ